MEGVTTAALEARGLKKLYGGREALRGVSFEAAAGELVAIIGPNGAGKTTLLSILAGILKPDGGAVRIDGGAVGWVPQQAALYRRLTVEENLLLFARLEGHEDPRASTEEMLELAGLGERRGEGGARRARRAPGRGRPPPLGRQPAADQHRDRTALAARGAAAGRAQRRARPAPAGAAPGGRLRPRGPRHARDLLPPRHPGGRALRPPPAGPCRR